MMTMNDFYRTVLAETSNDDVKAICEKYVAKADEKASSKAEMVNTILETLTDTPQTAVEIAESIGTSWQRVSSILVRQAKERNCQRFDKGVNGNKVTYTK